MSIFNMTQNLQLCPIIFFKNKSQTAGKKLGTHFKKYIGNMQNKRESFYLNLQDSELQVTSIQIGEVIESVDFFILSLMSISV